MVRNNELWDLGEPELNDRGQPVIHDIASQLGCVRPSPDLPVTFPRGAEDFAKFQAQFQAACAEMAAEDTGSRKLSGSSPSSPSLAHTERASRIDSDHSALSKDYYQAWAQQQRQAGGKVHPSAIDNSSMKHAPLSVQRNSNEDNGPCLGTYSARAFFDTNFSMPLPVYTDFQTLSPMFRKAYPFPSWTSSDDFLGRPHTLDLTAQFMQAQHFLGISGATLDGSLVRPMDRMEPNLLDGLNFTEGTITAHMLHCNGYDQRNQMDTIMFGNEYESQMGRACFPTV
jgi:hypothetical protein